MLKNDTQFSRAAALVEEEDLEDPLPLQTPVKSRSPRLAREEAPQRNRLPAPVNIARQETEGDDSELLLRSRRRLPARRSIFPKSRAGWALFSAIVVVAVTALWVTALGIRHFFQHDPRFRMDSASSIQIIGNSQLTRQELLTVFGGDVGRNIFYVPLAARRTELESLPWVEHATVMRLLPDQLRIAVTERTPVAFVRKGNRIELIDRDGVLLSMPPAVLAAKRYSFPVLTGVAAGQDPEVRADRMHLYERFVGALDEGGTRASETLSEVDLSDPEDLRAVLPVAGSDILVHFGDGDFANRYRTFQSHLPEWQREYPHLAAVDLRYDHQTVLEMAKGAESSARSTKSIDDAGTGGGKDIQGANHLVRETGAVSTASRKAATASRTTRTATSGRNAAVKAVRHTSHQAASKHAVHSPARTAAGKRTRPPAGRG